MIEQRLEFIIIMAIFQWIFNKLNDFALWWRVDIKNDLADETWSVNSLMLVII